MKSFSERLNRIMIEKNINSTELCRRTGIPKSAMSQYRSGSFLPKADRTYLIAKALNVSEAWLMGYDVPMERNNIDNLKSPNIAFDTVTFPVMGEIAAGYDSLAVEDWSGETVEIPLSFLRGRKKEEYFVLSVKGDSMYPLYMDGDKVLILRQTTLNHSGEIGAIMYEDYATLKKVEYVNGEDWLKMIPINPQYPPKRIEGSELEECRVLGIPKLLIREIDE